MDINKKKKKYEEYIKKQKLKNIKKIEIIIYTEERQERYIEGFVLKEKEEKVVILISINDIKTKKEKEEEIKYIQKVYGIKEIKNEDTYMDFVFYHEWGHVLQYEEKEEVLMDQKNKEMKENIMEKIENKEITEEEADKLYRELWFEKDADDFAIKKLKEEQIEKEKGKE